MLDVNDKETLSDGSPAFAGDYRRNMYFPKLDPEIVKRISELERKSKENTND